MAEKIKIKKGFKANLPTLDIGELGFCTDTKELYIGDGTANVKPKTNTDNYYDKDAWVSTTGSTGYTKSPDGWLTQRMSFTLTRSGLVSEITVNFPTAFTSPASDIVMTCSVTDATVDYATFSVAGKIISPTQATFRVFDHNNNPNGSTVRINAIAIGK